MAKFKEISANDIKLALQKTNRQYFVGKLSKPQLLPFITDTRVEIGMSSYSQQTFLEPHWHTSQAEYCYILQGAVICIEAITGIQHTYNTGDFYTCRNVCYSQWIEANTTILFIKTPSMNDKITCQSCPQDCSSILKKTI